MKILMLTPELAPFAQTGGLGDMVASLSKTLAARGHDVRVLLPRYGRTAMPAGFRPFPAPVAVHLSPAETAYCRVWESAPDTSDVQVRFIEYDTFFGGAQIYGRVDDGYRFAFQTAAALDFCLQSGWLPDIVHAHDWTAGLAPAMLNTVRRGTALGRTAPVFTIHNLRHQGFVPAGVLGYLHLPQSLFTADNYECYGEVNLMKGAIYHAAKVTTVSPTYAREILTPEYGCGLDGVLRHRAADLSGILNGIDTREWSPETDGHLAKNFSAGCVAEGKAASKAALRREYGLNAGEAGGEGDFAAPLFGVVSRLDEQKGLDLFAEILPDLLARSRMQVVILGSGDRHLEGRLLAIARRFAGKCAVRIGYDTAAAHRIIAASDFFVMPSRFEPCGLTQLYSMRYGTLPVARATGGLADSISGWTSQGTEADATGILFTAATAGALRDAMHRALQLYFDRREAFERTRLNAMSRDFTWRLSAEHYEKVYQSARVGR
ncbi:MAG: glycogen synthase GlgA [Puniceicoccales bacterium]|jgi:starch synthase|nr:glycogen synthase GlgA [Puniceicoccales bacterium]